MSNVSPPSIRGRAARRNARLSEGVLYRLRKRRDWRERASVATLEFATWPVGKPGREACETEAIKAQDKVRKWYRGNRAEQALAVIHRRAVAAFRKQFEHQ